jgi:hypothetical protein
MAEKKKEFGEYIIRQSNRFLRLNLNSPVNAARNSNYETRSILLRKAGAEMRSISGKISKYTVACCRDRDFSLSHWSDNVAFHKIMQRIYFGGVRDKIPLDG